MMSSSCFQLLYSVALWHGVQAALYRAIKARRTAAESCKRTPVFLLGVVLFNFFCCCYCTCCIPLKLILYDAENSLSVQSRHTGTPFTEAFTSSKRQYSASVLSLDWRFFIYFFSVYILFFK